MGKKPLLLKHVKLTLATHKRLRTLQVQHDLRSIDETIQQLLNQHVHLR